MSPAWRRSREMNPLYKNLHVSVGGGDLDEHGRDHRARNRVQNELA